MPFERTAIITTHSLLIWASLFATLPSLSGGVAAVANLHTSVDADTTEATSNKQAREYHMALSSQGSIVRMERSESMVPMSTDYPPQVAEESLLERLDAGTEDKLQEMEFDTVLQRKGNPPPPKPPSIATTGCFITEELFGSKCYKQCWRFNRQGIFTNGGYVKRVAPDACAKRDCRHDEEEWAEVCFKKCSDLTGARCGYRVNHDTCRSADEKEICHSPDYNTRDDGASPYKIMDTWNGYNVDHYGNAAKLPHGTYQVGHDGR